MTTIETRGRNVLAELDQRVPTSFYWAAAGQGAAAAQ
jgi:hypothetical protein